MQNLCEHRLKYLDNIDHLYNGKNIYHRHKKALTFDLLAYLHALIAAGPLGAWG